MSIFFASVSNANLILNGSFEVADVDPDDGTHAVGNFARLFAGNPSLDNWTILGGGIDFTGSNIWVASDGVNSIDLDSATGANPGSIEQTFSTTAGLTYDVQFDLSGNFAGGGSIKPLSVSIDGISSSFSFDTTGISATAMNWTTMAFSFVADDSFATLNFKSLNVAPNSGYGAVIDNISVNVSTVPVPAAAILFAPALLVLMGFRRKM